MATVAVVGCTHAGTFATTSILQEHPDWTVHVFERNDCLSFLSCGIALWVGNHVSNPDKMFYSSPEALEGLGAHMHMNHDVLDCDVNAKKLHAKDLKAGTITEYSFDKLVITTGSAPVLPPIKGLNEALTSQKVLLCKNWNHAVAIKDAVKNIKSAVVIGAGYIGAELAEQLSDINIKTTLIDALDHVLDHTFDSEISSQVERSFEEHGVTLALGQKVTEFKESENGVIVVTDKGEYTADIALLGAGFRPNTDLFKDQFKALPNGALIVDEYMRVYTPEGQVCDDIFAAGDSATVHYNPTDKPDYIPLATNAVRQGLLIGANIAKPTATYKGTQSTSAVQLYDLSLAASGMTLQMAKTKGFDAASTTLTQDYRPDFMLSTTPVTAILVWDKQTGRILGGQFISKHDISLAANCISIAIAARLTIQDLAGVDLFFQPNFSQPVNFMGAVALQAVAESAQ